MSSYFLEFGFESVQKCGKVEIYHLYREFQTISIPADRTVYTSIGACSPVKFTISIFPWPLQSKQKLKKNFSCDNALSGAEANSLSYHPRCSSCNASSYFLRFYVFYVPDFIFSIFVCLPLICLACQRFHFPLRCASAASALTCVSNAIDIAHS